VSSSEPTLNLEDARNRLGAPPDVFNALLNSGLLGYWDAAGIPAEGVEHFERFGTQWRPEIADRTLGPDPYQNLPTPPGISGGDQPPDTLTEVQIAPQPLLTESSNADGGWIAQFYIRPNRFFFAVPTALAAVGPIPLKLDAPKQVFGARFPTYLYPAPDRSLAMLMVVGNPASISQAMDDAYEVVAPILDELAIRFDQLLPIAHSMIVGIPSGVITVTLPKVAPLKTIAPEDVLLPGYEFPELADAVALYREGISSGDPFHRFLALWKAYENACRVRGSWRKRMKRSAVLVTPEVFPAFFAFGGLESLTFDQLKQRLNAPFRVALAHGDVEHGRPRTAASAKDVHQVASKIPVLRYMARVTIQNVRATLRTSASSEA
jgi:hypothetical protein